MAIAITDHLDVDCQTLILTHTILAIVAVLLKDTSNNRCNKITDGVSSLSFEKPIEVVHA